MELQAQMSAAFSFLEKQGCCSGLSQAAVWYTLTTNTLNSVHIYMGKRIQANWALGFRLEMTLVHRAPITYIQMTTQSYNLKYLWNCLQLSGILSQASNADEALYILTRVTTPSIYATSAVQHPSSSPALTLHLCLPSIHSHSHPQPDQETRHENGRCV